MQSLRAVIGFNLLDPSSWPGTLFLNVLAGLLLIAAVAILGWVVGPFKWWWRSKTLRKLILKRQEFVLVYNPHSGASKTVVFLDGGQIGDGRNNNEHTWRVRRGALEFLAADGKLWSRFKLDQFGGRLAATADSDIRSLFGQYLFPQHREAPGQRQEVHQRREVRDYLSRSLTAIDKFNRAIND